MWRLLLMICCSLVQDVVKTQNSDTSFDPDSVDNTVIQIFQNCTCVIYYQCDEDGFINTNGLNILDVRSKSPAQRPFCKGGQFEGQYVCCKHRDGEIVTSPPITTQLTTTLPTPSPRGPDNDIPAPDTTPGWITNKKCGLQRTIIDIRIFAGEDELNAIDGEFPWIAAIFKTDNGVSQFYCSGMLISPTVILTANHYFHRKKPENFKVILNGNVAIPSIGQNPNEERQVVEIINHPEYYGAGLHNDVALLILNHPYETFMDNYINKICLPPDNVNLQNHRCLVAGWGKEAVELKGIKTMKKVEVPYVDNTECQDLLRKTRVGPKFKLHNTFMCAGGEKDKDACKGDGGSPLMCLLPGESNRYFVAGIVSWGVGCGTEHVPGVYANVDVLKEWIFRELSQRNLPIDRT